MNIEIPEYGLQEWIDELPPHQRDIANGLLAATGDAEQAARLWITTQESGIVHLGGNRVDTASWWSSFRTEFDRFICDDDAYAKEKRELQKEVPITKMTLTAVISGAIALKIGFTATFLAPAVVLLLFAVGKMTLNSYCASRSTRRSSA